MTLRELIDALEEIAHDRGDDVEVRLAHQPRWAFEYSIREVQMVDLADDDEDDEDEERPMDPKEAEPIVYLLEGEQLGYLPGAAAQQFGWN